MKKKNSALIAPSVLSADLLRLEQQIRIVERAGADWIHLDIMDGHFVPNITFGPVVVQAIRRCTKLPLDAHLMVEKPGRFLKNFREAGADRLTVHMESCPHLHRIVQQIRELGMRPGVTLNPSTPAAALKPILPYVDLILVMTVNPGFGGQKFITSMLGKIREINRMIKESNPAILLEVDGGVSADNAAQLVEAGARVLVAGNSIFGKPNIGQALRKLRKAASL